MEYIPKFILYKKLLIFGDGGVGKSTMSLVLQCNDFVEEQPSKGSK
jgi:GTPase SAR1 family protein